MTEPNEQELIRRAAAGNMVAFRAIYDANLSNVTRQVARLVGPNKSEVEDVVQEVFIQAHRSLPKFRADSKLSTWLYRLTWNVTISHLRRRKKPLELTSLVRFAASRSDWSKLEARDQLRTLYAALDEMSSSHREAFILFEIEGLSLQEIAELSGDSINTVASRIRRTRERLRGLLEATTAERRHKLGGES